MIILDTHAWIWWASEDDKLSKAANAKITQADDIGVSIISCWEVAVLVAKRKIGFNTDVQDWIDDALGKPKIRLLSLDPKTAILSTRLPGTFHGDPGDRFLAAACLNYRAPLVTKDKKIHEWGFIQTIW